MECESDWWGGRVTGEVLSEWVVRVTGEALSEWGVRVTGEVRASGE